jgi:predicted adenylyl cyclase CyaB
MQEVEVKFLEIDKQKAVRKLTELGARKVFEGEIYSENFDFPDRRIAKGGSTLRLRRKKDSNSDFAELTIKTNLSKRKAKISDESEFIVKDYAIARRAILRLGLKPTVLVRKRRTSYTLGRAHFEFDTVLGVRGVPTFLEVESDSLAGLRRYVAMAGLSMKKAKAWSLRDVLRHYGKL